MKKTLTMVLAMVLVAAISVSATLAYLTSKTEVVTNTMTVGNVKITLDETEVDELGVIGENAGKTQENDYKLLPNHTYVKDPTVHVDAKSENAWLFVKVVNEIAAIEADTKIAAQMATNGWTLVDGETNVYAYKAVVHAGENIPVFGTFKVAETVDNDTLAAYAGKTIKVQAYAVQEDGFGTAAAAWADAKATWNF